MDFLAKDVEIKSDGWFESLMDDDRHEVLGRYYLNDPNAKFLGSWGNYRVFTGKFKKLGSRRVAKGYAVMYSDIVNQFMTEDHYGRPHKRIPAATPFHGDLRDLKAFLKISTMKDNRPDRAAWDLFYSSMGKKRIIEFAERLTGDEV